MFRCADHLHLMHSMIVSNVWLLTDGEGDNFLIDSGIGLERWHLRAGLWRALIRRPGDLSAVILTHRHCDHAGNASWLRETFRCPVYCHQNDAPILAGRQPAPRLRRGIGTVIDEVLAGVEDLLPARCDVDEAFSSGEWRFGFTIFPAFGHTEGSVLLYHAPSRTLFTGDALLSGVPPFRFRERYSLAIAAYSLDVSGCHRRVLEFLADPPPISHLCSGHGPYVGRDVDRKLRQFRVALTEQSQPLGRTQ